MLDFVRQIVRSVEPLDDPVLGPRYRCSVTLKDGFVIPCVSLQSRKRLVDLAKRRIREEMGDGRRLGGYDPYGQIVSSFAASGNRIADYDVATAEPSPYAIPPSLLSQIEGETTMGWTGWVFRMTDGASFSFGSDYSMDFINMPENYSFSDVAQVFNHSFANAAGKVISFKQAGSPPERYNRNAVFHARSSFVCAVDGL